MSETTYDSEYGIIHIPTGRIEPIDVYETKYRHSWERVYAQVLVDLLDLTGESQTKIIAYLIKNKDYKNVVAATVRKISAETNCSTRTVQRTLKSLADHDFIHRLQNGLIMFSPHIMRTGKEKAGMAVIRRWNDAHAID